MNRPHSPFSLGTPGSANQRQESLVHRNLPQLILKEVDYPERIIDIGQFRIQGWRNEKGVDPDFFAQKTWLDDLDQTARHWVVMDELDIVAAARLSFHGSLADVPYADMLTPEQIEHFENRKVASLNRLVVLPEYRGQGLAGRLDQIRIEMARVKGAEVIIAFPQLVRIESLRKLGFELLAELPSIPEMPDRPFFLMKKNLV
ncbi:GNAT family N-acetyltransferase [Persicitalea jodogahamensis]|uniref:N-acetyltransferase domain-containing protein n=1 Tax=Persicitalea jodogahamensis TaxID=402147 RepID=A0A8J3D608_9BACT|nr:GNAT family N-acetyltransferase [Persicitalea jodogahamensis]GHB57747.1 hypothetical protein GCM10007390_08960 [Persicitalea jodogahamensis]